MPGPQSAVTSQGRSAAASVGMTGRRGARDLPPGRRLSGLCLLRDSSLALNMRVIFNRRRHGARPPPPLSLLQCFLSARRGNEEGAGLPGHMTRARQQEEKVFAALDSLTGHVCDASSRE